MNEQNLKPFKKGVKHNYNPEAREARRQLKDLLKDFSEDHFDDFVSEYEKLRGKSKCEIFLKVLEYVRPKYSAIQFEDIKEARNALELLNELSRYKKDNE